MFSFDVTSHRLRVGIIAASVAIYAVAFLLANPAMARAAAALVTLPVVVTVWFFGVRGVVIALLLAVPANGILFNIAGVRGWESMPGRGDIAGWFVLVVVAIMAGLLNRRYRRFKAEGETLRLEIERRKSAEEEANRLAEIVESSHGAITSVDKHMIIMTWNPAAERLYGYTADEITGKHVSILFPPELIDTAGGLNERSMIERSFAGDKIVGHETIRIRKDGTTVDVSLTMSQVRDADGKPIGNSAITREITEQKRAEKAAQQLAAIVELSDDAITAVNLDGIITDWNSGAERLYGYSADEVFGKHMSILQPPELVQANLDLLKRVIAGDRVVAHETVRVKKDGTSVDVSFTLSPIKDSSGRLIGTSAIVRDITERKRAEKAVQQLAAIVESSVDAITAVNLYGIITDWNPGAERLYAYTAKEIIGQHVSVSSHPICLRLTAV